MKLQLQRKGVRQSWSHREGQKAPLRACLPCTFTGGSKELLFPWLAAVCTCGFKAVVLGHPHPCVQSLSESPSGSCSAVGQRKGSGGVSDSYFLDRCEDTLLPPCRAAQEVPPGLGAQGKVWEPVLRSRGQRIQEFYMKGNKWGRTFGCAGDS